MNCTVSDMLLILGTAYSSKIFWNLEICCYASSANTSLRHKRWL